MATSPRSLDVPQGEPTDGARAAGAAENAVELTGHFAGLAEHGDAPVTPARAREILAVVLGLPPNTLRTLSDPQAMGAVDRLNALVRRLEEAAATDSLTSAMSRGAGMQALRREMSRGERSGHGVVVAVVDVDGLKAINDTQGHLAGDRLLGDVVAALRTQLRAYDVVVRFGGDEFVCVFTGADMRDAERRFEEVARRLAERGQTVSVGLAQQRRGETPEQLIGRADAAMYAGRARRGYRGRDAALA